MDKNTISVRAYVDTGEAIDILENATSGQSIKEYFMPLRSSVEGIVIRAVTEDGQVVTLSIGQESITGSIR